MLKNSPNLRKTIEKPNLSYKTTNLTLLDRLGPATTLVRLPRVAPRRQESTREQFPRLESQSVKYHAVKWAKVWTTWIVRTSSLKKKVTSNQRLKAQVHLRHLKARLEVSILAQNPNLLATRARQPSQSNSKTNLVNIGNPLLQILKKSVSSLSLLIRITWLKLEKWTFSISIQMIPSRLLFIMQPIHRLCTKSWKLKEV